MSRKGVFTGILALALVFGFAATGWAGGGQEPTTVPTISLDVVDRPTLQDNTPVQQYLEKKYGVKFKIVRMGTGDARESSIATLAASGDLPDVLFATGGSVTAQQLHAQDAIGPIDLNAFKTYAPKTFAAIDSGGKTYGYDPWYGSTIDGKVYGFSTNPVSGLDFNNIYTRAWRLDLLKKIGINKVPETLDDFEAIGKAQVAADPSVYMMGDGAKNFYGGCFTDIYGAFSAFPDTWVYSGGKIQNSSVLPETRQAVAQLADWYKKGYIDPEWLTDDIAAYLKKLYSGKHLSATYVNLDDLYAGATEGNKYREAKKVDPNAELVPSPWVKGPTGKAGWPTYTLWGQGAQHMFSKKMAADPVKMQKYFEILDGFNFDDETYLTASYGIKGKDWNIDANGTFTNTALTQDQTDAVGNSRVFQFAFSVDRGSETIMNKYKSQLAKDTYAWQSGYASQHKDVFALTNRYYNLNITPMPTDVDKTLNSIKDIMKTAIDGIIINTKPLSAFDDAVTQWLAAGGQAATDFINANDMRFIRK